MTGTYRAIPTAEGTSLVRAGSERSLLAADASVFDCDGVLVDARNSYDATTAMTVELLLEGMLGTALSLGEDISLLIHKLRKTGGFNNDWDTTYALTAFAVLSLPSAVRRRLASGALPTTIGVAGRNQSLSVLKRVSALVDGYARRACGTRASSIDRFVREGMPPETQRIFEKVRAYLKYPGEPPASLLSTLFDEIYHGESLFKELYGFEATHKRGKGLIENERLLVGEEDLDGVSALFRKGLAIDTGRPRKAAEHTLKGLMERFDLEASLFLGDRTDSRRGVDKSFRKPSPLSLLFARDRLRSSELLYVGDSAEDLMMAEAAGGRPKGVSFAGVYGSSYNPADQIEFFRRRGADLIIPSARSIPEAYRSMMGG